MATLLLFYNEDTEQEYVVLTQEAVPDTAEWAQEGFVLFAEADVDDEEIDMFPTERKLWKQS